MIKFKPIGIEDKELYERYMPDGALRGCEFSFANLYMWGNQNFAELGGALVMFSDFDGHLVYPYPIGMAENVEIIDAILKDAEERGIRCRISGVTAAGRELLERSYPDKFDFKSNAGSYDYIYNIDDLAELKGRKYQSKRNHYNRFRDNDPDYYVEEITEENLPRVKKMLDKWYEERLAGDPDADFEMEREAFSRMARVYSELCAEGLMLVSHGEIVAFTVGTRMTDDTFDVHFEKASAGVDGAYAAINLEFARFIRAKYPEIRYLNREEDMGIEGLRRAKQSYHPCARVEKCRAKYKG